MIHSSNKVTMLQDLSSILVGSFDFLVYILRRALQVYAQFIGSVYVYWIWLDQVEVGRDVYVLLREEEGFVRLYGQPTVKPFARDICRSEKDDHEKM